MELTLVGQAIGLFTATNVDDIVVLALFFGQAVGRGGVTRVVLGQYLGFAAILAASILGSLGAGLLPETAIPYLGLLPLLLGLRATRAAWPERRTGGNGGNGGNGCEHDPYTPAHRNKPTGRSVLSVAAVTLAIGGDNIGVYVPVFATAGVGKLLSYVLVFLALVAVWCAAGHFLARRPLVARALSRWGHILLPLVLIGIGLAILIEGHAFGL